ncbi:hypothetical protein AS188_06155 [Kocuria flava]|uniref:Phosphate transport regulator n=1 Tax=Kocuria flava TaxID=446860 RepID=A0A0U3I7U3_9MICC|nr:hypothetical protein [Kocuria flava]ALU39404.1 hypothetical protein AS188_06155 [Kocuria flava]GEO92480.1 hypothetical protein KFL01_17860 [Kocuria flava]
MALRIFPEDEQVLDLLAEMSEQVTEAVRLLSELLGSPEHAVGVLDGIRACETRSTDLFFSVMTTVRSTFAIPLPRQDVYILGEWLNRAAEELLAVAEAHVAYGLTRPPSYATDQLGVIVRMSELTTRAMRDLGSFEGLDDYWYEMLRLGKQAERIHHLHLAHLLEHHNAHQALRRERAVERFVGAARALGQVATEVGRIVVAES